jgi:hypothetical protein
MFRKSTLKKLWIGLGLRLYAIFCGFRRLNNIRLDSITTIFGGREFTRFTPHGVIQPG